MFQPYPFEKLNALLDGISPKEPIINLSIGEPQFDTPDSIQKVLRENTHLLNKYPNSKGEEYLKQAQLEFVKNRYALSLQEGQIIPTFGTREVLFNFPQYYLFGKKDPFMAFPNPFYQIYEGAAISSRARVKHLNLYEKNDFKPRVDAFSKEELQNLDLLILNSPNNPTGATMSIDELGEWVRLANEYDFVVLNDECYSEIYCDDAPASILQASERVGNKNFHNILALNSISKRSSAPGLRSGFIAGDINILKDYGQYRSYVGASIPLPLQKASALAWRDMESADKFRAIYAKNLRLASEIFPNTKIALNTFYLWLKVRDDLEACKKLYIHGIKVLAGRFLGREEELDEGERRFIDSKFDSAMFNPGQGYLRIALVYESDITELSLKYIKEILGYDVL